MSKSDVLLKYRRGHDHGKVCSRVHLGIDTHCQVLAKIDTGLGFRVEVLAKILSSSNVTCRAGLGCQVTRQLIVLCIPSTVDCFLSLAS